VEFLVVLLGEADLDRGMGAMKVAERLGEAAVDGPCDADFQSPVKQAV